MKKTGEILKKAREEKGLSLHEIGLSLKISSKVLKAIEEGDDTQLPAKTFLRGFVQSYANFLHLDTDKILELFYEEMGSTKPKPYIRPQQEKTPASTEAPLAQTEAKPVNNDSAEVTPAAEAPVTPEASVTPLKPKASTKDTGLQSLNENKKTKTFIFIGIGIALLALIIFTKKMIDKYSKEAEVPSSEVAQTIEGATPVSDDQPTETLTEVEPETAPSPLENLAITTTPAATETMSTAVKPAVTPTPSATPSATPVVTPTPSPVATATPTPSASPTPTPTPAAKPEPGKPVELIVEALDSVEIEYSAPNGKPQKIRLSSEQVHTFKSRSGLRINFSNGGAINLILNGKEIGIPGDLGKPIKLSY